MFPFQIYSAAQIPEFRWQAAEVVREVDHRPHLLVRVSVTGGFFPHRASPPVMQIAYGNGAYARSWFTQISPDNRTLHGYFAPDLPEEGIIEFGYPDALGRVHAAFSEREVRRLLRDRLDKGVVVPTQADLARRLGRPQ